MRTTRSLGTYIIYHDCFSGWDHLLWNYLLRRLLFDGVPLLSFVAGDRSACLSICCPSSYMSVRSSTNAMIIFSNATLHE